MLKFATKFLPCEAAFETAFQAGFRSAEFWLDAGVLSGWRSVAALARRYPFHYALHFPNRGNMASETLEHAVLLYRELDCQAMVIHQPMFDKYADRLLALDPTLALAVENHDWAEAEFHRWAERNPGLTLDVEHFWKYTLRDCALNELLSAMKQFLARYGPKLQHVHLPGYQLGGQEHRPLHHAPQLAVAVLDLLTDVGFTKLVVSEAELVYQNLDDLRHDVRLFEDWSTRLNRSVPDKQVTVPRIAVTMGDPAGVGPELCLRLLQDAEIAKQATPVVFGDAGILQRVAQHCGLPEPERILSQAEWPAIAGELQEPAVLDLGAIAVEAVQPGHVDAATGRASYRYIEAAISAALSGQVAAVATGPIHKEALHAAGIPYPGHTEIFAARTGAARSCMMLTSEEITCSLVTTHVGYRDVPGQLSVERILEVIELTAEAMRRIRGRPPRLVVCGLNPHAGEHGLFGAGEEERFIAPAVAAARQRGIDVEGPLPPDTAFVPARRRGTDAFVCMYHDQGLIPLKALAFDTAVNVTLGLPIIRTSVDHGTALDIAWTGRAQATSLVQAVLLAARLAASRDKLSC